MEIVDRLKLVVAGWYRQPEVAVRIGRSLASLDPAMILIVICAAPGSDCNPLQRSAIGSGNRSGEQRLRIQPEFDRLTQLICAHQNRLRGHRLRERPIVARLRRLEMIHGPTAVLGKLKPAFMIRQNSPFVETHKCSVNWKPRRAVNDSAGNGLI